VNCALCRNGRLRPGTKTNVFERDGTVLVVRDVPALVCDQCGDTYYDPEVTDRCRLMLNDAVSRNEHLVVTAFPTGVQVSAK